MHLNAMFKKKKGIKQERKKKKEKRRKENKENVYTVFWFPETVETIF